MLGESDMHAIKEIGYVPNNFTIPGQKIRALRKQLGYNQRDFAYKANMSPSALNRIESGQSIQPRRIVEISELLGIHPKELSFNKITPKDEAADNLSFIKKMFPNGWKEIIKKGFMEL